MNENSPNWTDSERQYVSICVILNKAEMFPHFQGKGKVFYVFKHLKPPIAIVQFTAGSKHSFFLHLTK